MGVLILSPTEKAGMLAAAPRKLAEVCAPFSPLHLAHRWLLTQLGVTTLAVGAGRPEHLDAHLSAAAGPDLLDPQERKALDRWRHAEIAELGATRCTVCFRCMPCPEQVAIPEILRLRNLAKTFDMIPFGKMRYNLLGAGADWFPGLPASACTRCGTCLPRCPEGLAIPDLLEETHELLLGEKRRRVWNQQ
jgi:hypothetical protein